MRTAIIFYIIVGALTVGHAQGAVEWKSRLTAEVGPVAAGVLWFAYWPVQAFK